MDKEELKKIIVSELKQTWTHPAEVIADRILTRIPDEIVIANGVCSWFYLNSMPQIKIGYKILEGDEEFQKFEGKNIRLKIEIID